MFETTKYNGCFMSLMPDEFVSFEVQKTKMQMATGSKPFRNYHIRNKYFRFIQQISMRKYPGKAINYEFTSSFRHLWSFLWAFDCCWCTIHHWSIGLLNLLGLQGTWPNCSRPQSPSSNGDFGHPSWHHRGDFTFGFFSLSEAKEWWNEWNQWLNHVKSP